MNVFGCIYVQLHFRRQLSPPSTPVIWSASMNTCAINRSRRSLLQSKFKITRRSKCSVLLRIAHLIASFVNVSAAEVTARYINWKRINVRCSICYRLSNQLRTSISTLREKRPGKLLNFLYFFRWRRVSVEIFKLN